jgi:heme oxygenase
MEILNALRRATGPIHQQIEQLPLCKEMLAGTVDRATYVRLLDALYHLHAAFESEFAACPQLMGVWPTTVSRAAALRRDLAVFGVIPTPQPQWVVDWVESIRGLGHPAAWAGAGYVFEGSRMGSRVLVRTLARGFALDPVPGVGLDYHLDAGDDPNGTWRRVMGALAEVGQGDEARAAMVAAAVQTFQQIYDLHEAAPHTDSCEMTGVSAGAEPVLVEAGNRS